MTDSFLHPDGHHYRVANVGDARMGLYFQDGYGRMVQVGLGYSVHCPDRVFFERVESPLWPWTSPGAVIYTLTDEGFLDADMDLIPPEDFAGLAERLAKQAALNEGDA